MKTKHTELPWCIDEENPMLIYHEGLSKDSSNVRSDILTIIQRDEPQRTCEANATFIVRACNSHEALLEACKAIVNVCNSIAVAPDLTNLRNCNRFVQVVVKAEAAIALADPAEKGKWECTL